MEATTELASAEPAFGVVAETKAAKKLTVVKLRKALESRRRRHGWPETGARRAARGSRVGRGGRRARHRDGRGPVADRARRRGADTPAPPAEALVPQTPAQRDTMLSSVTRRSPRRDAAPKFVAAPPDPGGEPPGPGQSLRSAPVRQRPSEPSLAPSLAALEKAKDMERGLGQKVVNKITRNSQRKTIEPRPASAALLSAEQVKMVSKEDRIREKNLEKATRMYSKENAQGRLVGPRLTRV